MTEISEAKKKGWDQFDKIEKKYKNTIRKLEEQLRDHPDQMSDLAFKVETMHEGETVYR